MSGKYPKSDGLNIDKVKEARISLLEKDMDLSSALATLHSKIIDPFRNSLDANGVSKEQQEIFKKHSEEIGRLVFNRLDNQLRNKNGNFSKKDYQDHYKSLSELYGDIREICLSNTDKSLHKTIKGCFNDAFDKMAIYFKAVVDGQFDAKNSAERF